MDDDGKVEVDHGAGVSVVQVSYDEDATMIGVGKLTLVVARTQASLFVENEGLAHRELL